MLGRLARYLRFFGHDAEYARDSGDTAIAARAVAEHRVLITRDRRLAARVAGSIWVGPGPIEDQLRTVRDRFPEYRYEPSFERCSVCNGPLRRFDPAEEGTDPPVPLGVLRSGGPVFVCALCRHPYWEGSHTAQVRARVAGALGAP